jgi:hypothetical protein
MVARSGELMADRSLRSSVRELYVKKISRETKKNYTFVVDALNRGCSSPLSPAVKAGLRRYAIVQAPIALRDTWMDGPVAIVLLLISVGTLVDIGEALSNAEHISAPT